MVNHTPPFQTRGKTGEERRGAGRGEQTTIGRKETQWCSGITCVLAELRAHYPEHQHEEEEEEEDERQDHTHPSHHRYSAMTQPCRKTHTPNQQYCDSEHAEGAGEESNRTQLAPTRNTPPPFTTRTTAPPHPQHATQGEAGQHKAPNQSTRGITTRTTPAIQHRHPANRKGTPTRGREDQYNTARPSLAMPPRLVMPPHHPRRPAHHHEWGEGGQRMPHHTNSTDTHTTTHHKAERGTVHDTIAVAVSTAPGRAGHGAHRWTGRTSSTHHRHSMECTRRMDTIHSSTLTLFTFAQPTNDHDQHDQQSMINQQSINNE